MGPGDAPPHVALEVPPEESASPNMLGERLPGVLQGEPFLGAPDLQLSPTCSAPILRLPPAPQDPLAQLLQVLQDLKEAHRSSPAGSPSSEPSHLLELQT